MRNKKIIFILLIAMLTTLFPIQVFADVVTADTVYINGNIYTVDENFSKVEAIAIKGQYIIGTGSKTEVEKFVGPSTQVIDLQGKTVIPGLIEGHMHYPGEGQKLIKLDVFWKPKDVILAAVKAEADRLPDGDWITGGGWNQEVWDIPEFPTKEDLDSVAPNNPVALKRTCGHATWVNSLALQLGEITKDTPNPQGGEILKDANGEPTGILTDTAAAFVNSKIPPLTEERKKEALLLAQEELFSYGLTTSMDAGSGVEDIQQMKDLYESGDLKIRLYVMVDSGPDAEAYYEKGPEVGLYDNRLTMNCIKFYTDGSLGARSAWMLEEYSDRAGHFGNSRHTYDEFYELIKAARDNGFQVATHAIGDAANKQVVDIYEKVLSENPLEDHRYRIEHFQVATLEDIQRIADLGIIPAMQSVHATSDKNMAEDRVGSERIKGAYAWRKVLNTGNIIVNGSDANVELVNPYHGLYAAVTRAGRDGEPVGGWYPEECMTREEALRSFTIWAAYGQFEDKIKGSLEEGKLADFVVIDRDYMTCPSSDIKDILPLTTVVGGEVVYTKDNSNVTVVFQGDKMVFDSAPVLENGTTYVLAKNLFVSLGLEFTYDEVNNKYYVNNGSSKIEIDAKDVVYVPLRAAAESLGYKINWYQSSMSVSIGK
ncbi:amidohydrolase family protein [Sedimentibacter saalensis]|uniref:amidohydrolase family protein n=1 Tax=Sedimentibacter saalensis TaxID=130788 RepID=UPI002899A0AD|nr:amidohydrolase family protein [Sedimentibacter saalensis]